MNTVAELKPLLTQKEVSEMVSKATKQSYRHVYERVIHTPNFPQPKCYIPSPVGGARHARWEEADIINWLKVLRRGGL